MAGSALRVGLRRLSARGLPAPSAVRIAVVLVLLGVGGAWASGGGWGAHVVGSLLGAAPVETPALTPERLPGLLPVIPTLRPGATHRRAGRAHGGPTVGAPPDADTPTPTLGAWPPPPTVRVGSIPLPGNPMPDRTARTDGVGMQRAPASEPPAVRWATADAHRLLPSCDEECPPEAGRHEPVEGSERLRSVALPVETPPPLG